MRVLFAILTLIVGGGCIASHQSMVADVDVEWWGETKSFALHNADTTTHRDLEIFTRYYPSLVCDTIQVFIDIETPSKLTIRERVTLHLDKSHTPRQESRVSIHPYRNNVVWAEVGDYKIDITPQINEKGVEAIGINTVKSN